MAKIYIPPTGPSSSAPPATPATPSAPTTTPPATPATPGTPGTPPPATTPAPEPVKPLTLKDVLTILGAMAFAFVTYIVARVIMPDNIEWWARELFALVIAGGLLAGIGQAVDRRTVYAKSVATFLFVVFAYFMITGYANNVDSTPSASKKIAATVLSEGVNLFDLQPGESTGWLTFKDGTKSTYSVASESYEYHMYYSDGTDYVGAEDSTIPEKKHSVFYVLSTSKERQIVKITVTRII